VRRAYAAQRVPGLALMESAMNRDDSPELRLVDEGKEAARAPAGSATQSISRALMDEEAGALGLARTIAEKHHLPLVDLGITGVDPEAAQAIALPVLNRGVAI